MTLVDGASHEVDSSDWSFFQATTHAFEECYEDGNWILLEPIMSVEVTAPEEFQGKSTHCFLNSRFFFLLPSAGNV